MAKGTRYENRSNEELLQNLKQAIEELEQAEDTLVAALAGDKPDKEPWARNKIRSTRTKLYAIRHELSKRGLLYDPHNHYAAPPKGRKGNARQTHKEQRLHYADG